MQIHDPGDHDGIWVIHKPLTFFRAVYDPDRTDSTVLRRVMAGLSARLGRHREDRIIGEGREGR